MPSERRRLNSTPSRPTGPPWLLLSLRGDASALILLRQHNRRLLSVPSIEQQHPAALLHELALGLKRDVSRDFCRLHRALRVEPDLHQLMRLKLRPDLLDDGLADT